MARRSALHRAHQRSGAFLTEADGWLLPARYADPAQEYHAALRAVAVTDRASVGRLRAKGKDVLDLLNRLSTNKVDSLRVGKGVRTVLTTAKGRIVDVIGVSALEDGCLILTGPGQAQRVARWIDDYTFSEDCAIEDWTRRTGHIGVLGPRASRLLHNLSGERVADLPPWHNKVISLGGAEVTVVRTDATGVREYDLIVPRRRARGVWRTLLRRGARYGLRPLGSEAWEMLRVHHGVGRSGREYTDAYNPLEAGLRDTVSFKKGCYIGQEVVARLNAYHKVQRRLVGLEVAADEPLTLGSPVQVDGRDVGTVTSVARVPDRGQPLALAYVRKEHVAPGTHVQVGGDGRVTTAQVVKLPAP